MEIRKAKLLQKLIQQGEHQQQDFKFCINDSRKIAKSLVAFANTDGGRLLIGVKDNGHITGVRSEEEYYMVEAAATIYSKPTINFETKQWTVEGKTVLEVTIVPSPEKPHFAKDETGKWIAYIREGDENLLANRIQVEVWKKQKSPKGIFFTYSDNERFLINYLSGNYSISLSKFIRLAHVNRYKAIDILSNFVLIGLLLIRPGQNSTEFILNHNFEQEELAKFQL
ncbi:putative ATP-dependent DNA helicase [hydrothermal vent metagenome]|uniref:Putative ATP-dependent DNA helicase n=1 Tax=hydrothermal vent metagenome TaxID=652676 RepID=A0A3B0TF07_9ZZZZ